MRDAKRPPGMNPGAEEMIPPTRDDQSQPTKVAAGQGGFFERIPYDGTAAPARRDGPETSHEAARSISPDALNRSQRIVLNALLLARKPLTDEQTVAEVRRHFPGSRQTDSAIRTRRRELELKGRVQRAGHGITSRGRRCLTFEAVRR